MNWWQRLWKRRKLEDQLQQELLFHFEEEVKDLVATGLSEAEARRRVQINFGGSEQVKEQCRDVRGTRWLEDFAQDVRYALRTLRKSPSFAVFALAMLALGMGANTAVFSVLNGLLIRSLPFPNAGDLVWITDFDETGGPSAATSQSFTYRDLRKLNSSFTDLAAYNAFFPYVTYNMTGTGEPERLLGVDVTENFFSLLGVKPALGRFFLPEECLRTGRRAIILTYRFWNTRFAADPSIVGRAITINAEPVVVVGILPSTFDFASVFVPGAKVDIFTPRYIDKQSNDNGNELAIIGRLKPGVSLGAARSDLTALAQQFTKERGYPVEAHAQLLRDHVMGHLQQALIILAGAVGFVLLIACANLSNLLLARASIRKKEIALRLAVGAGRFRLVRQMLTESLILSLLGGILGLPLAFWGTRLLANLQRTSIPMLSQIEVDWVAFAFTLLLSALTGILFGLVPAVQAARSDVHDALKESTAGAGGSIHRHWTRGILVVSEVALALILLGAASLTIKSLARLLNSDFGFRPEHVAIVRIDPGPQMQDPKKLTPFLDRVLESVRTIPGIEAASVTDAVPLDRDRSWGIGRLDQSRQEAQPAFVRAVGPDYFKVMRIPLLAGRTFDNHDTATSRKVVVINETMAKYLFPNQNPLGREIYANGKSQIIGVVRDVRHSTLETGAGMEFYFSYPQGEIESADLVVRTTLKPEALVSALQQTIWQFAPHQPLSEFRTLEQLVDTATSSRRFTMTLLGIFAALAILLAAIGIYGVIAYSVEQRTREIGIRMTLGANSSQLLWQVIRQALGFSVTGTAIGILGLLVLSRYLSSLLFEVSGTDPIVLSIATVALIGIGAVAGYLPARRAAHISPVVALRFE